MVTAGLGHSSKVVSKSTPNEHKRTGLVNFPQWCLRHIWRGQVGKRKAGAAGSWGQAPAVPGKFPRIIGDRQRSPETIDDHCRGCLLGGFNFLGGSITAPASPGQAAADTFRALPTAVTACIALLCHALCPWGRNAAKHASPFPNPTLLAQTGRK